MPAPTENDKMYFYSVDTMTKADILKLYLHDGYKMEETAQQCSGRIASGRNVSCITRCYGFYSDSGRRNCKGILKKLIYLTDQDFIDCVNMFPDGCEDERRIIAFFEERNRIRAQQSNRQPVQKTFDDFDDFDDEDFGPSDFSSFGNNNYNGQNSFSGASVFDSLKNMFSGVGSGGTVSPWIVVIIAVIVLLIFFKDQILALLIKLLGLAVAAAVLIFAFKFVTGGAGRGGRSRSGGTSPAKIIGGIILLIIGIGGFKNGAASNMGSTLIGIVFIAGGAYCLFSKSGK